MTIVATLGLAVLDKFEPVVPKGGDKVAVDDITSGEPVAEHRALASHVEAAPSKARIEDKDLLLPRMLENASDADWIAAYPQLMGLTAIELWNFLDRPELRNQPRAQWLMRGVLIGCVGALDELDANLSETERRSTPITRTWCASLSDVARDIRSTRLIAIAGESDLQSMSLRLPPVSLLDDASEQAGLIERSQEVLARSRDITILPRAVENLLFGDGSALTEQLPAWDQLPRSQRQPIATALQAVVSCEAISACGTQSFLTYRLCSSSDLFACQQGAGMQQTVYESLSPRQLQLFDELMARVRGIRSRPGGA